MREPRSTALLKLDLKSPATERGFQSEYRIPGKRGGAFLVGNSRAFRNELVEGIGEIPRDPESLRPCWFRRIHGPTTKPGCAALQPIHPPKNRPSDWRNAAIHAPSSTSRRGGAWHRIAASALSGTGRDRRPGHGNRRDRRSRRRRTAGACRATGIERGLRRRIAGTAGIVWRTRKRRRTISGRGGVCDHRYLHHYWRLIGRGVRVSIGNFRIGASPQRARRLVKRIGPGGNDGSRRQFGRCSLLLQPGDAALFRKHLELAGSLLVPSRLSLPILGPECQGGLVIEATHCNRHLFRQQFIGNPGHSSLVHDRHAIRTLFRDPDRLIDFVGECHQSRQGKHASILWNGERGGGKRRSCQNDPSDPSHRFHETKTDRCGTYSKRRIFFCGISASRVTSPSRHPADTGWSSRPRSSISPAYPRG